MTRKRYIKLLMASGCDRNTANAMARATIEDGDSYAQAYEEDAAVVALVAHGCDITARLQAVIEAFAASIPDFAKRLADAIEAVTRQISQMDPDTLAGMMQARQA